MNLEIKAVYFVKLEESDPEIYNPVAIKPTFNENKHLAFWEDTSEKGKVIYYTEKFFDSVSEKEIKNGQIPQKISIIANDQKKYSLLYLTKQIYDENVKTQVYNPLDFENDSEVQKYYLETDFSGY